MSAQPDLNADLPWRTAGIMVEVVPTRRPGHVVYAVNDIGPQRLSLDEVVRILRAAADQLEESAD